MTPYENGAVHNLKDKKRSHRTSSFLERYHPGARVGSLSRDLAKLLYIDRPALYGAGGLRRGYM